MKRYADLNTELRRVFGTKTYKLSLNGGFTCPNRLNGRGCVFCGQDGSAGFAVNAGRSMNEQAEQQKRLLSRKWKEGRYIAYFGTYTSTYADAGKLDRLYGEALRIEGVGGLAIATRPDCLGSEVISLLEGYNKKTYLWIELGFQTMHTETHALMETGYDAAMFTEAMLRLKEKNIRAVPHAIFGLPGETEEMMLDSIRYINKLNPWGIKIHMLYILRDSLLYEMFMSAPFRILSFDEYTEITAEALEILDPRTIIHRLTGDPPAKSLYLPQWVREKQKVLQAIDKNLAIRDSFQGRRFCVKI